MSTMNLFLEKNLDNGREDFKDSGHYDLYILLKLVLTMGTISIIMENDSRFWTMGVEL